MKKILQLLLVLCATTITKGQTFTPPAFADIDNNYRTYVNQVFGALEANRVPTGLLADYGFDFTNPKFYNGTLLVDSTLMEQGIYSELYKTIFTSKFNNNAGTLRHPSIHDSLCYIARQKEVITLSGLLFKYNAVDPNAQANGKMQTVNGQLKDVYTGGVWQNPYQEFTTVAISPSTMIYNLTYCSVKLPSNIFLSNMLSQINNIQFDANDGLGYRNIAFDVPINLNYADTGWKHWMFRITLTSGQQLYSHSKVYFNNTSNAAGSGGNVAARGVVDRRATVVATESYLGVFGVADIVISYRNQNDQTLRRPLIVAEGFDPGWITNPEEPEGQNSFLGFIRNVSLSGSGNLVNLIGNAFNPNAASQYDIIYVNWRNGVDHLQRNELVLEAVIRWVNQRKQPLNGTMQPNVVLGSSMGGVIARMALGRMDRGGGQNGAGGFAAHQTSLYISVDAPHQGANVPLGYQAAVRHATRQYIATGPIALGIEAVQTIRNGPSPLLNLLLADQPAAKQLLKNRIDLSYNTANTSNQQFLQDLRTLWAYPANIRNVAISNGSECGIDQEFAAGSTLLYHYRSTKTRFIGDLIFMAAGFGLTYAGAPAIGIPLLIPGSNKFELTIDIKALANGGGNQVYYGNLKLTKKVLWLVPVPINIANKTYNAPTGLLPFDTYPGGFYTVTISNQPGSISQDWMFSYNNSFFIQRRFSFIPTVSALDIGQGNTALTNANYVARYVGAIPPATPFNTPFANFITAFNNPPIIISGSNPNTQQIVYQFTSNGAEPHEGFFVRNANWLAQELNQAAPPVANCSFACNGITGPANFCTSANYTVDGLTGTGATITWALSPTGIVNNSSPNAATTTLTRVVSGKVTLTATVNNAACGTSVFTKIIKVGGPTAQTNNNNTLTTGGNALALSYCNNLTSPLTGGIFYGNVVINDPVGTSFTWTLTGKSANAATQIIPSPDNQHVEVRVKPQGSYATYQLAIGNSCGSFVSSYTFWANTDCIDISIVAPPPAETSRSFSVTPNPSQGEFNINSTSKTNLNRDVKSIYAIKVTDCFGVVQKEFTYKSGINSTKLSLNDLRNGIYMFSVFDGKIWESKAVVIAR